MACTPLSRSLSSAACTVPSSSGERTRPVCSIRSSTSTRSARAASASGFCHLRSYRRGMRRRRISRTSRNPAVVMSPVRTPRRSRIAFVATVVPWMTSSISRPPMPMRGRGLLEALGNAAAVVVRGGRHLDGDRPPGLSEQDEVGERPSDVDAYGESSMSASLFIPAGDGPARCRPAGPPLSPIRPCRAPAPGVRGLESGTLQR